MLAEGLWVYWNSIRLQALKGYGHLWQNGNESLQLHTIRKLQLNGKFTR